MKRIRLAVLYGGRSAEHQVSVVSARSVMEALDPDRFEVVPIAITRDGAWLLPDRSPLELTASEGALPEVEAAGTEVAVRPERGLAEAGAGPVDVVFPILHGPFGEDGTVQGLFELADLPYVGSGVLASALAMDKAMAKVVLAQAGLPQAPYLVVPERDWRAGPGPGGARGGGGPAPPGVPQAGPARLPHRHLQGQDPGPAGRRPGRRLRPRHQGPGRAGRRRPRAGVRGPGQRRPRGQRGRRGRPRSRG